MLTQKTGRYALLGFSILKENPSNENSKYKVMILWQNPALPSKGKLPVTHLWCMCGEGKEQMLKKCRNQMMEQAMRPHGKHSIITRFKRVILPTLLLPAHRELLCLLAVGFKESK